MYPRHDPFTTIMPDRNSPLTDTYTVDQMVPDDQNLSDCKKDEWDSLLQNEERLKAKKNMQRLRLKDGMLKDTWSAFVKISRLKFSMRKYFIVKKFTYTFRLSTNSLHSVW